MAIRTVRADELGVYIEANGTKFRPTAPGGHAPAMSRYAAGQRVLVADGDSLTKMGTVRVGTRPRVETWRAETVLEATDRR